MDICNKLFDIVPEGKPSDTFIPRIIAEQELGYVDYREDDYHNPVKSVTHHQTMHYTTLLEDQIDKLITLDVPGRTHTSIHDLLKMPVDLYDMIVKAVGKKNKTESDVANELTTEMEEELAKLSASNNAAKK